MILFGQNPSQGTLLKASQFLSEELPIRLSQRVVELESLPNGMSRTPGIEKVKEWYAQSFEASTTVRRRMEAVDDHVGADQFPKTRFDCRPTGELEITAWRVSAAIANRIDL